MITLAVAGQHRTTYLTGSHETKKPFSSEELSPASRFEIVLNCHKLWGPVNFPKFEANQFSSLAMSPFWTLQSSWMSQRSLFFWCSYSHLFSTSWILLIFPAVAGYIPHFVWVKRPLLDSKGDRQPWPESGRANRVELWNPCSHWDVHKISMEDVVNPTKANINWTCSHLFGGLVT